MPGKAVFAVTFHNDVRDKLWRGHDEVPGGTGPRFTIRTFLSEAALRLPRGITLRARVPVHWKEFEENAAGVHAEKNGLGDVELLASVDLWRGVGTLAREPSVVTATLGVALPTGVTEAQPIVGEEAPTPLQLGGGTVDPLLVITGRHAVSDRLQLDAGAAAHVVLYENRHDYRSGSVLDSWAGGEWRPPVGPLGLRLLLEWSHVTKATVAGAEVPSTGRDVLYFVPGLTASLPWGPSVTATASLPLYVRTNDTQLAGDILLAVRVSFRARLRGSESP